MAELWGSLHLNYNGDYDKELLKYIPIATVACFEAFFRSVIKELIDFGKPFSENAVKFNQSKNVKFDFDIINAIQSKTVTVGEFISHILPCNNFEDINTNLSTISGIDFTQAIKTFERKSIYEDIGITSSGFLNNSDKVIADIKRIFELRHIFCHEFATNVNISRDEILRCFSHSKIFLKRTNDFIWDLLYPNAPETQTDMNIDAHKKYQMAEDEMSELIFTIKQATKGSMDTVVLNVDLFDQSIDSWKKYRDSKAELDASIVEGGSMYSMAYSASLTLTTKEKLRV